MLDASTAYTICAPACSHLHFVCVPMDSFEKAVLKACVAHERQVTCAANNDRIPLPAPTSMTTLSRKSIAFPMTDA